MSHDSFASSVFTLSLITLVSILGGTRIHADQGNQVFKTVADKVVKIECLVRPRGNPPWMFERLFPNDVPVSDFGHSLGSGVIFSRSTWIDTSAYSTGLNIITNAHLIE